MCWCLMKQMLMEECNYSEKKAEYVIERIKTYDEQLQPILDQWMKDKSISDHAVNVVTLEMVYKYRKVSYEGLFWGYVTA